MTRFVFWEDPYLRTWDATVVEVRGGLVVLDGTIFFAFSGGQESDAGTVAGRRALGAVKEGFDILHDLGPDHGLRPGDPARVEIDWPRRYALMRLHFAAEIVLEVASEELGRPERLGAHISADKSRIDFAHSGSVAGALPAILERAQAVVDADLPIVSAYSDEAARRRYWEVEGFARVPCGGTHLRRTGEVGRLRLKRKNQGKGLERIEVTVE